ncbi:ATP-binding protein [Nocardiopsis sp. LOL_012]|uniref:ATP-binding protein n=1 Tax=Nocardiopsis sp. LOL_012 TaxID=3345409 RepID=UPI003A84222D
MNERSTPAHSPLSDPGTRRFLGRFPAALTSVGEARHWLRQRLDLGRVPETPRHDALLILSEIATNALLHAPSGRTGGGLLVSVFLHAHGLHVAVRATSGPDIPHLEVVPAEPDAERGRGLFLVESLAHTWGVERTRSGGPCVYFSLAWPSPRPEPLRTTGQALPRPRVAADDVCGR